MEHNTSKDKLYSFLGYFMTALLAVLLYFLLIPLTNQANAISYPCQQFESIYHDTTHNDQIHKNTVAFVASHYENTIIRIGVNYEKRKRGLPARYIMGEPSKEEFDDHYKNHSCQSFWEYRGSKEYEENKLDKSA